MLQPASASGVRPAALLTVVALLGVVGLQQQRLPPSDVHELEQFEQLLRSSSTPTQILPVRSAVKVSSYSWAQSMPPPQ